MEGVRVPAEGVAGCLVQVIRYPVRVSCDDVSALVSQQPCLSILPTDARATRLTLTDIDLSM